MFKKKKCPHCNEKISEKFSFCPSCGKRVDSQDDDYGMLGKNDVVNPFDAFEKGMLGGISGKMLNKMLGGAMKMLEREMQKSMEQTNLQPKTNFELYINGKKINPKNIKVTQKEIALKPKKKTISQTPQFNEETQKRFSELTKEEPKTQVRRFANKVVYELDVPGVTKIQDVSVLRLENSLEIRALAKEKAYKKIIPVNLPVERYKLSDHKLILELGAQD